MDFSIPKRERVWTGQDVSFSYLKVFSCKPFIHIPKEQWQKLDSKATPYLFLGYGDVEFGYRLLDSTKNKLLISKDVVFHEQEFATNIGTLEKPNDTNFMLSVISVSFSIESVTDGRKLYEKFGINNEPVITDVDDANTKCVVQGK